jgi:hypothetical protein
MNEPFSDQLRQVIRDSGMTRYALSVQTGIDQAVLSKFMAGKIGLSLRSIDKLMDVLGLEVRPLRKRKDD